MYRMSQSFRCGLRSDPSQLLRARRSRLALWSIHFGLALGLLLPSSLLAQDGGGRRHSRDFLLGKPHVTLTLRGGMLFPANSRVYPDTQMSFPGDTARRFKRSDLNAPLLAGELAIWTPRADITVALGYARSRQTVEYRFWLDNKDMPIENSVSLAQVPLTVGLKAYVLPRGRAVGRYAYIPSRFQPYVGIAGGTVYHQFRESGDFVNFDIASYPVYGSTYKSSGWAPTVQLLAGNEISLARSVSLQVEVRYGWASGHVGTDFPALGPPPETTIRAHDKIDVSGLQTTLGFAWRL